MKPHWDDICEHWVDLDKPVTGNPEDGYQGISDPEIAEHFDRLRAKLAAAEDHCAQLKEGYTVARNQQSEALRKLAKAVEAIKHACRISTDGKLSAGLLDALDALDAAREEE